MPRFLLSWVVIAVLLPAWARADDLQEATRLVDIMEYKKALKAARRALKSPNHGPVELVAAYRIQGLCLSALGKAEMSLNAFRRLLAIDPNFKLSDDLSPKLAAPFYQAMAMSRTQKGITLRHHSPESPDTLAGLIMKITLAADPMHMVKAIELRFHTDLATKERRMVARINKPGTVAMKLPKKFKAREIRYYFKATNKHGGALAFARTKEDPFVLAKKKVEAPPRVVIAPVAPPKPKPPLEPWHKQQEETTAPWYQTWWFWTAAGVATAMIVGGVILAAESGVTVGPVDYGILIE
jgi:tetratricopeptide (TPR) repeat protein